MKNHKFDEKFLFGLYLLLRQIELSIDRSYGGGWKKMVVFFSRASSINPILEKLKSAGVKGSDREQAERRANLRVSKSPFFSRNFLNENEVAFIQHRLAIFESMLKGAAEPAHDQLVELRLDFSFLEDLVKRRISKKLGRLVYVEHFNQSENLNYKSIDVLLSEQSS